MVQVKPSRNSSRPNPGRDYLYARFSLKEPFDLLYFTPALTQQP